MPRLRHAAIADAAAALAMDPKSTTAWSLPSIATASTRRFAVNYVGLGELAKARASADRVTSAARTAQAKARRPSRRQGPGLRPRT
jgi:hypothetical protein